MSDCCFSSVRSAICRISRKLKQCRALGAQVVLPVISGSDGGSNRNPRAPTIYICEDMYVSHASYNAQKPSTPTVDAQAGKAWHRLVLPNIRKLLWLCRAEGISFISGSRRHSQSRNQHGCPLERLHCPRSATEVSTKIADRMVCTWTPTDLTEERCTLIVHGRDPAKLDTWLFVSTPSQATVGIAFLISAHVPQKDPEMMSVILGPFIT